MTEWKARSLNPITRIYIDGGQYPKICIDIDLPNEVMIRREKTKKITLETGTCWEKQEAEELFDTILKAFGITMQKSNLSPVTFVNMFCSDKDAKLSDVPQPIPRQQGVLL